MADVRALLKAKREEKRVVHSFAAYNRAGQLRCTACTTVIKHASAWTGHLGSKLHRTNAARVKEEERLRGVKEEKKRQGKRKAEDDYEEEDPTSDSSKKRRIAEDDEQQAAGLPDKSGPGFPANFFSDPSRPLPVMEDDIDEEGDNDDPPVAAAMPQSALDLEWAKFQEVVINAPGDTDSRETFERATVFAEPQLSTEIPEGFPSSVAQAPEPEPEALSSRTDEGAERRRREEEEKELIMDRLLDEELAQEEADSRVNVLKAKLDLLRQKRMAAKAAKSKK